MKNLQVIVSDDRFSGDYEIERGILRSAGIDMLVPDSGSSESFMEAARTADGILVNLRPMDAATIRQLAKCRILSRYGVGYDNIDIGAASEAGIWVSTVPDYSTEEVSDQALALMMACARLVAFKHASIKAGRWNAAGSMRVNRIKGSILGLVGYGHIGKRFHEKAAGLGFAETLVYDPYVDDERIAERGGKKCDLQTLAGEADFISVHAPLTAETRHLIGDEEIARMKKSAILVNTARGPIVDEAALGAALAAGKIRAAGLDVFETEPLPLNSPLRGLDNVVLSDHCAYYSLESIAELKEKAARNIVSALVEGRPLYPINDGIAPRSGR